MTALKVKALAHLEMMRPYTMFHSGLLAVAGAEVASGGHVSAWRTALAALVTMCGWEAGLYAGDYYDRDIDARSKPTRPVPSGRVSPREAFATMVGLIVAGYACALVLGLANLALAVVTTVLGIAYSKTFKARALLGNFDRGVLGVCAVLFGALAAADGHVSAAGGQVTAPFLAADSRLLIATPVLFLAALAFFHDSATNLVGAVRDVEGDRAAGCPTVPVVYGVARAVEVACGLALCWVACGCVLMALVPRTGLALTLFAVGLAIAAAIYVPLWPARAQVVRSQALAAHKYLIVERLVLMSAFIALYAPPVVALALLASTVASSIGSQWLLRDRYEQQQVLGKAPQVPQVSQIP